MLFACGARTKQIAVCAGTDATGGRYAQYRYGTRANVELAYPTAGIGTMRQALIGYSGGGQSQIHFTNAGHDYVVYSQVVRTGFAPGGTNDPAFEAGVFVLRGGRTLAHLQCTRPSDAAVDLAKAEAFLPVGKPVELP